MTYLLIFRINSRISSWDSSEIGGGIEEDICKGTREERRKEWLQNGGRDRFIEEVKDFYGGEGIGKDFKYRGGIGRVSGWEIRYLVTGLSTTWRATVSLQGGRSRGATRIFSTRAEDFRTVDNLAGDVSSVVGRFQD